MCHQCTNYEYTNIILFLIIFSFIMLIISCYGVKGDISFGCSSEDLFRHKINSILMNEKKCINYIKIYESNKKEALAFNFDLQEYMNKKFQENNPGQKCEVNLDINSFEKVANTTELKNAFVTLLESNDYNNISKNKNILEIFVNSSFDSIKEETKKNEFSRKLVLDSISDTLNKYLSPENIIIIKKSLLEKK